MGIHVRAIGWQERGAEQGLRARMARIFLIGENEHSELAELMANIRGERG
jgi:hypothetical protein